MREIEVKNNYSCPFHSEETIMLSEMTADTEVHCGLKDDHECYGECPLIEAGGIKVIWKNEDKNEEETEAEA